jgi:hypothetical protein
VQLQRIKDENKKDFIPDFRPVLLGETEDTRCEETCWFSKDQAEQFSKIKGGQYVTLKGIFNGEAGVDLKFCKLAKIDGDSGEQK